MMMMMMMMMMIIIIIIMYLNIPIRLYTSLLSHINLYRPLCL